MAPDSKGKDGGAKGKDGDNKKDKSEAPAKVERPPTALEGMF